MRSLMVEALCLLRSLAWRRTWYEPRTGDTEFACPSCQTHGSGAEHHRAGCRLRAAIVALERTTGRMPHGERHD